MEDVLLILSFIAQMIQTICKLFFVCLHLCFIRTSNIMWMYCKASAMIRVGWMMADASWCSLPFTRSLLSFDPRAPPSHLNAKVHPAKHLHPAVYLCCKVYPRFKVLPAPCRTPCSSASKPQKSTPKVQSAPCGTDPVPASWPQGRSVQKSPKAQIPQERASCSWKQEDQLAPSRRFWKVWPNTGASYWRVEIASRQSRNSARNQTFADVCANVKIRNQADCSRSADVGLERGGRAMGWR